jgi:hypothetical protein
MRMKILLFCLLSAFLLAPASWAQTAAGQDERDPHLVAALELRTQAKSAYEAGDYDTAADLARKAKAELALVVVKKPEAAPAPLPVATKQPLPASYTVRLMPDDRDCLSKIAGYPFVYGDRKLWVVLYKANKTTLKHPEDADIILPGEVLVIPSLSGEERSGEWEEGAEYPSYGEK